MFLPSRQGNGEHKGEMGGARGGGIDGEFSGVRCSEGGVEIAGHTGGTVSGSGGGKVGLRVVVPAPFSAVLELGGERRYLRRALMGQRTSADSAAYYNAKGRLLCVVMVKHWRARRVEFALMVKRAAIVHMTGLMKLARALLAGFAEKSILVFAHVNPLNEAGKRLARLAGFCPGKFRDKSIWIFKG